MVNPSRAIFAVLAATLIVIGIVSITSDSNSQNSSASDGTETQLSGDIATKLDLGTFDSTSSLQARATAVEATHNFLSNLTAANVFSGVVTISNGTSKPAFSRGYGMASVELGVPLKPSHKMPIGSNTKFFVAVALWQLHAQGKLHIDDPISKHLTTADPDLRLPTQGYCPRLAAGSTCQPITIRQLLGMCSGLWNINGGNTSSQYNWRQWDYSLGTWKKQMMGALPLAEEIRRTKILDAPLTFVAGTKFEYNNMNYILAEYIVQQVSRLSFRQYMIDKILGPLELQGEIIYDISGGVIAPITPGLVTSSFTAVYEDQPDYQGSGFHLTAGLHNEAWNSPMASNLAAGAGFAAGSTAAMQKWFRLCYSKPELLGLNRDLMQEMLQNSTPGGNFAQGMIVPRGNTTWPSTQASIQYQGGIANFNTLMKFWPEKQVALSVFSNLDPKFDTLTAPSSSELGELYSTKCTGSETVASASTSAAMRKFCQFWGWVVSPEGRHAGIMEGQGWIVDYVAKEIIQIWADVV